MSTQLQQFSFEKDGLLTDVRVHVDEKGDTWFVAKDVCSVLGYKNTSLTISKHCEEKGISKRYTLSSGGEQELLFINEGNLYRLIIKSHLPAAKQFETFVCDTVLPSIRKHGYFQLRDMSAPVRQVIDLQNQAVKLTDKLEKTRNPSVRESIYTMLTGIYALMQIAIPPLDAFEKPAALPAEHPLIGKFFERIAMLEAKGYQLNHSRNHLIAINLPQFINLRAEEKLPSIARYEWAAALRTSPRLVDVRSVNSAVYDRTVKCWLFTAEVSA